MIEILSPAEVETLRRLVGRMVDSVLEAERANGGKLPEGFGLPEPEPETVSDAGENGAAAPAGEAGPPADDAAPRP